MEISVLKKEIYQCILDGNVSRLIIDNLLMADGAMLAKECELWDYKKTFETTDDCYLKTLKSIVSFHNTYGGYIIYGIEEIGKDEKFLPCGIDESIIDQQKLRGKFDKYFAHRLDLTYVEIIIEVNGENKRIGLLHIPKRNKESHSISPIINGATSKNKNILARNAVYFRKADECKQVISQKDFEFIVSERNYLSVFDEGLSLRKKIIEHNLPDKNYICPIFIGRFEIIQELWSWLADEFQYAKVLAADGGKGKTSIAYEFCQLLIMSGTEMFEQVIWLTAKKKQYKAVYDSYVASPETHYFDLETLLRQICLRTGSLPEEIEEFSWQQLQRTAKENLLVFPSFIVIDDVDSNTTDEQRRITEMARVISNSRSRVLLTTRVNSIYSSDSSIEVPGLKGDDYKDLIVTLCRQLKLPEYNVKNIEKIRVASEGSPLFTESILRICRLGESVDSAILEWKGKSGEAVREAALRKEVSELSPEAIRILLTISFVESCSKSELHQLTDMESAEINSAIEELGNLFLIQGIGFIENEPRFETSFSISNLALSISDDILPNAKEFLERVKQISEGLKVNLLPHVPEVGAAIKQCTALIQDERYVDAKNTVLSLIKKPKFKENSDLYFMLAKTEYTNPLSSSDSVRKSFSTAFIKGQRKAIFFEMWYQVEIKYGSGTSVYDVCTNAVKEIGSNDEQWCERFAEASFKQSESAFTYEKKINFLVDSYQYASRAILTAKSQRWERLKNMCVQIVNKIWSNSLTEKNYEVAAKAMINALRNGDIRTINYDRLIDITKVIHEQGDADNKSPYMKEKLNRCIVRSIKALKADNGNRNNIVLKLEMVLEDYPLTGKV